MVTERLQKPIIFLGFIFLLIFIIIQLQEENSMKLSKNFFYILALSGMITFSNVSMASAYNFKLNLYKQGISHSDVNAIQNKLKEKGYLNISKTTNYYGSATKSSIIKFQKASGLKSDGIAGKNTLGKLFEDSSQEIQSNNNTPNRGTNISRESVTALNWSSAQNEIPRGSTFMIEDYKTGITFNMKRTYGTNHADIESLTKEDTQKIKNIWGGFSWARRPVIVHIDNKQIIASMSAMPHAGRDVKPANVTVSNRSNGYGSGLNLDSVKGNGMDGHVDLHFLNSLTHGTQVKDSAHQNNIRDLIKIFSL
jgi:hypothetical protein